MKRMIVLALLLLAGVAGAGEMPIQDEIREGVSIGTIRPSGVTNTSVAEMFFRLHFAYIDYRHPWPVRWYDAAVKWLKAHLWWPVGEAEAGQNIDLWVSDNDLLSERSIGWKQFGDLTHGPIIRPTVREAGEPLKGRECIDAAKEQCTFDGEINWPCFYATAKDCYHYTTYPQFTIVPWDEVNEFLRTEAKEGRVWEYVDIIPSQFVGTGKVLKPTGDEEFQVVTGDYVILKREVTE